MVRKTLSIRYEEYYSIGELPEDDRSLLEAAIKASEASYAPYSNYNVGAAVRLDGGRVVLGANQENVAFPSGLCAEMTAISSAHANNPGAKMEAIAIAGVKDGKLRPLPTFPCGECRQILTESQRRAGAPIRVIVGGGDVIYVFSSVISLLPFGSSDSIVNSFEEN